MIVKVKKINNFEVKPIPGCGTKKKKENPLFSEEYPNVYLLAKKKTGKTTVIYNILKEVARKDTIVVFFCGSLFRDESYTKIIEYLDSKKIKHVDRTSMKDDEGNDSLKELLDHLVSPKGEDEEEDDFIFVIDDLSAETKYSTQIKRLLKANRHIKAKVFISTQNLTDLPPDGIAQMQYVFAFTQIPEAKLEKLYTDLSLSTPYQKFIDLYYYATKKTPGTEGKSRNFLYIDVDNQKFRKNFNELLMVDEE